MDKQYRPPMAGAVSLVVLLLSMSVATFALLGLQRSGQALRMAEKSRDASVGYYRAQEQANVVLAGLRAGGNADAIPVRLNADGTVSWSCPVSGVLSLQVSAEVDDTSFRVGEWRTVPSTQWEENSGPTVWDGGGLS